MDKENIIISIIIVLCIAAAVAAYGITNTNNPIFSDLSSMSASDTPGSGIGNKTVSGNGSGHSVATTHGNSGSSSGGASSGTSDSGSSSGGSSSGNGGSSDGGNGGGQSSNSQSSDSGSDNSGSNSGSSSSRSLSQSDAQSIADAAVLEPGCYAGSVYYSDGYWYATIYDENGTAVDSIGVNDASGSTERA